MLVVFSLKAMDIWAGVRTPWRPRAGSSTQRSGGNTARGWSTPLGLRAVFSCEHQRVVA